MVYFFLDMSNMSRTVCLNMLGKLQKKIATKALPLELSGHIFFSEFL